MNQSINQLSALKHDKNKQSDITIHIHV